MTQWSWCLLLICFLGINSSMPEVVLKEGHKSFAEYDWYLVLIFVYREFNLDVKPSQFALWYKNILCFGFETRCVWLNVNFCVAVSWSDFPIPGKISVF